MATESGVAARRAAAEAVAAVAAGRSLADALPAALARVPERDRALAQELAYGTVRFRLRHELVASRLLRKPPPPAVSALIQVGLHQLHATRVPPHAAVSATVAAAPERFRALVNAVLRNAQRQAAELDAVVAADECAATAHPRWLLDALKRDWPDDWRAIVDANNTPGPMTLRVRGDRDGYRAELERAGLAATPVPHAPRALELADAVPVSRLPRFQDGAVSVQDAAAQLAAPLVDARAGMRVLDACAAPGGKACHLLELEPTVALTALEIDPARATRIEASLARLGLRADVVVADAEDVAGWWDGVPFARVLVDAPCSATGVVRRHPDIRALRREADIMSLAARQRALLDALWPVLAPGGRLVYATCSVLRAENDAVVGTFAAAHADARVEPVDAAWGRATAQGRQVLPGQDGMDGFYYAVVRKEAP